MYRDGTGIDNITVTCGDYRVTVVLEMSAKAKNPSAIFLYFIKKTSFNIFKPYPLPLHYYLVLADQKIFWQISENISVKSCQILS